MICPQSHSNNIKFSLALTIWICLPTCNSRRRKLEDPEYISSVNFVVSYSLIIVVVLASQGLSTVNISANNEGFQSVYLLMTVNTDPVSFGNWYLMWPSDLGVTLVTGGRGCNLAGIST